MEKLLLVNAEEWLFRRGYSTPEKKYMNPDGTATSRVFKLRPKDNGRLSVDVKSLTSTHQAIQDPKKYFLFEIHNAKVISLGLATFHDPLPDGSNEAHAFISGMQQDDEITPGLLAKNSRRVYLN
ncbi:MAG: hypothetical protein IH598_16125 [Bacteroidales bacterium]|nr:hypothetical protein [Bacteroidales bacterium]